MNPEEIPTMTTPELIRLRVKVRNLLDSTGEALVPKTDKGRELLSTYFAIIYQLNQRGVSHGRDG